MDKARSLSIAGGRPLHQRQAVVVAETCSKGESFEGLRGPSCSNNVLTTAATQSPVQPCNQQVHHPAKGQLGPCYGASVPLANRPASTDGAGGSLSSFMCADAEQPGGARCGAAFATADIRRALRLMLAAESGQRFHAHNAPSPFGHKAAAAASSSSQVSSASDARSCLWLRQATRLQTAPKSEAFRLLAPSWFWSAEPSPQNARLSSARKFNSSDSVCGRPTGSSQTLLSAANSSDATDNDDERAESSKATPGNSGRRLAESCESCQSGRSRSIKCNLELALAGVDLDQQQSKSGLSITRPTDHEIKGLAKVGFYSSGLSAAVNLNASQIQLGKVTSKVQQHKQEPSNRKLRSEKPLTQRTYSTAKQSNRHPTLGSPKRLIVNIDNGTRVTSLRLERARSGKKLHQVSVIQSNSVDCGDNSHGSSANESLPAYARELDPSFREMGTQSFVPTNDAYGLQRQQLEAGDHGQRRKFGMSLHESQLSRPIGRASSASISSSSSSLPFDGGRNQFSCNTEGAPLKPASEQCAAILPASQSIVSLSDDPEGGFQPQHQHQQLQRNNLATGRSSSTNALGSDENNGAGNQSSGKNFIGKFVGKKASRFRELLLQNFGKADRTRDDLFDHYEFNFYKQQQHVQRLAKEFKLYSTTLRNYHEASIGLGKCIQQSTSDYQLARHDLICENLYYFEQLNEDQVEKVHQQMVKQVGEYLTKFDEIKEKISKRHRKLIDFDSSRRAYETMLARVNKKRLLQQQQQQQQQQQLNPHQQQTNQNYQTILKGIKFLSQHNSDSNAVVDASRRERSISSASVTNQLVDEARLLKLQEQFNYCKLMYETINGELQEELPTVYDQKMKGLLEALQGYYELRTHYHTEAAKLTAKVADVLVAEHRQAEVKLAAEGQNIEASSRSPASSTSYESYGASNDDVDEGREECTHNIKSTAGQILTDGVGGGSSGVGSSHGNSTVDSASPSGSSSVSPDCGQRETAIAPELAAGQDHACPEREHVEQDESKNVEQPAVFGSGERQLVEDSSMESAGEQIEEAGKSVAFKQFLVNDDIDKQGGATKLEESDEYHTLRNELVENSFDGSPEFFPDEDQVEIKILDNRKPNFGSAGKSKAENEKDSVANVAVAGLAKNGSKAEEIEAELSGACEQKSDSIVMAPLNGKSSENCDFLYKVRTNYKYLAEDVDELCFEADEVIKVIEFDENHEPEDGWLLGVRELNDQRGLFPANFTQPI